jgi:hypothetical protein
MLLLVDVTEVLAHLTWLEAVMVATYYNFGVQLTILAKVEAFYWEQFFSY